MLFCCGIYYFLQYYANRLAGKNVSEMYLVWRKTLTRSINQAFRHIIKAIQCHEKMGTIIKWPQTLYTLLMCCRLVERKPTTAGYWRWQQWWKSRHFFWDRDICQDMCQDRRVRTFRIILRRHWDAVKCLRLRLCQGTVIKTQYSHKTTTTTTRTTV